MRSLMANTDYNLLIDHMKEWHENLIHEMCADDKLTCDDLCGCTEDCIVVQAISAITTLMEQVEDAKNQLFKQEELKAAGRFIELPCKIGDPVWTIEDECNFGYDCHTTMMCDGCEYHQLSIEPHSFCLDMLGHDGKLKSNYFESEEAAKAVLAKKEKKNGQ